MTPERISKRYDLLFTIARSKIMSIAERIKFDKKLKFLWRRFTVKTVCCLHFRFVPSDWCNRCRLDSIDLIKEFVAESGSKGSSLNSAGRLANDAAVQGYFPFPSSFFFPPSPIRCDILTFASRVGGNWVTTGELRRRGFQLTRHGCFLSRLLLASFFSRSCKNALPGRYVLVKR